MFIIWATTGTCTGWGPTLGTLSDWAAALCERAVFFLIWLEQANRQGSSIHRFPSAWEWTLKMKLHISEVFEEVRNEGELFWGAFRRWADVSLPGPAGKDLLPSCFFLLAFFSLDETKLPYIAASASSLVVSRASFASTASFCRRVSEEMILVAEGE